MNEPTKERLDSYNKAQEVEELFAKLLVESGRYVSANKVCGDMPYVFYDIAASDKYGNVDLFEVKTTIDDRFLHIYFKKNNKPSTLIMTKAKYWVVYNKYDTFRIFSVDKIKQLLHTNNFPIKSNAEGSEYWDIGNKLYPKILEYKIKVDINN